MTCLKPPGVSCHAAGTWVVLYNNTVIFRYSYKVLFSELYA